MRYPFFQNRVKSLVILCKRFHFREWDQRWT